MTTTTEFEDLRWTLGGEAMSDNNKFEDLGRTYGGGTMSDNNQKHLWVIFSEFLVVCVPNPREHAR